jgi:hypothetical protein
VKKTIVAGLSNEQEEELMRLLKEKEKRRAELEDK